jgi:hypothetical protein
MSISVTGTIVYQQLGAGTWSIVTDNQQTYELKDPPSDLRQSGLKVTIEGKIRDDVMTLAMIGPVLEVISFTSG